MTDIAASKFTPQIDQIFLSDVAIATTPLPTSGIMDASKRGTATLRIDKVIV